MSLKLWSQATEAVSEATEFLAQSSPRYLELLKMGFAGATDMRFPDPSPAAVILQLRQHRSEETFERWKESFVREVYAAVKKSDEEREP